MRQRFIRLLPDIIVLGILLAAPLVIFFPQTVEGRTLVPVTNLFQWEPYKNLADDYGVGTPQNALYSDLILENYAWRQYVSNQVSKGQFPLWQPNIMAGSPFLAAGQSLALYPLSLIYLILPLASAYGWFTVIQLWIAGINTYVLARTLKIGRTGGLIAALTYELSSFMLASAVFPMILAAAAWLPLELAMIERISRPETGGRNLIPPLLVGAFGLAMAALGGHIEILYITLLVMAFYALWRLAANVLTDNGESLILRLRGAAAKGLVLAVMVLIGLALGAVQLIPAYELASRSFREGAVSLDQVRGWALPPRHILAFLMPNFYGSPAHHGYFDFFVWRQMPITHDAYGHPITTTEWGIKNYVEGAVYTGVLPMILAVTASVSVAWRWFKNRTGGRGESSFMVLGLLSLTFAFGLPTYNLLYYGLPFFNQSHSPFRWAWPLTLCVGLLAGFGADLLARAEQEDSPRLRRIIRRVGWGIAWAGGLIILALFISRLAYGQIAPFVDRAFMGLALAPNAFPDARTFYSYQLLNIRIFAVALILSGLVFILVEVRRALPMRLPAWRSVVVLVVIADLFIAVWGLHPAEDPKLLGVVPPSIQWLKDRQAETPNQPFRVMPYIAPDSTKTINANMLWLHGLEDAAGYDSLIPAQYVNYMKVISEQGGDLPYNRIAPIYSRSNALDSPLLDLLGVRYIVSETEITNLRWQQVYQDDAVRIYENTGVMPRAFTLRASYPPFVYAMAESPVLPTFGQIVQNVDVRDFVLVAVDPFTGQPVPTIQEPPPECGTDPTKCLSPPIPGDPLPASITVNQPLETWIDAEVDDQSWLVVANSYAPGWRAWVRPIGSADAEEKEVKLYLVDGNFQGVLLEPGRWTVRLKYSPDSFKFGALASFLTLMACAFIAGVWAWPRLYREEGTGSDAKRVAKNTLTPILLNLFNKGISFVLTFVSLRVLGPEGTGHYTYAVVIWGWFEIFSNFGLNTYLTREVSRHRETAGRYLASTTLLRLALTLIGIPVLIGFIVIRQTFVAPPLDVATQWTIGLLYAGLFFSTISTGLTALFYAFEKAEYPAAIQTISAFLTAALGVGALLLGYGIIGLAVVSIVVNAITLAILWRQASRHFGLNLSTLTERSTPQEATSPRGEALRESFPLMLNHLLATLFFRIQVVLLEAIKGATVVGWYRVVYTWVDTVGVIPALFTMSLFPVMSRQASEDKLALRRAYILAVKLMTLLSVPLAIFTTLLAPVLVNILGGPEYLPHGAIALQIFIWAMIVGWMNSVTQYVLIALNRQRTLTIAFVIGAAFNVVANLIFIPQYSYVAASTIAIFSEWVLFGAFYVVIRQELRGINWLALLWRLLSAGILAGAVTLGLSLINMWLALIGGVVAYGVLLLVFRPLDEDEQRIFAGLLPESIRRRFRVIDTQQETSA